jgi:hypothetical protein
MTESAGVYRLLGDLSATGTGLVQDLFQYKKCRGLTRENTGVCPAGGEHSQVPATLKLILLQ